MSEPANMGTNIKVSITYCSECGYGPQALSLTEYLMQHFEDSLSSIELIPWYEGAFDVAVGDTLVHSMYRDGGFPEHRDVGNAVREKLGKRLPTVS